MSYKMKILVFALIAGLALSCSSDSINEKKSLNLSKTNTNSAINDSIGTIMKRAALQNSIYENKIRSELFKNALSNEYNFNNIFGYAKESLNNGDTEIAITIIQDFINSNPKFKNITQQTKMIHEFLAICYLRKGEQLNCQQNHNDYSCLLYTSPSPRDATLSRMPSSA